MFANKAKFMAKERHGHVFNVLLPCFICFYLGLGLFNHKGNRWFPVTSLTTTGNPPPVYLWPFLRLTKIRLVLIMGRTRVRAPIYFCFNKIFR